MRSPSAHCCTWRPTATGAPSSARSARLLAPAGRLVFDVFAPGADDIADTHGRWLEREPGIWERADWNERTRTLILHVRGDDAEAEMSLAWLSVPEWKELLREEGFVVDARLRLVRPHALARRRRLDLGLPQTRLSQGTKRVQGFSLRRRRS